MLLTIESQKQKRKTHFFLMWRCSFECLSENKSKLNSYAVVVTTSLVFWNCALQYLGVNIRHTIAFLCLIVSDKILPQILWSVHINNTNLDHNECLTFTLHSLNSHPSQSHTSHRFTISTLSHLYHLAWEFVKVFIVYFVTLCFI